MILNKKAKALWHCSSVPKITVETPYAIINTMLDPGGVELKTKIAKLLILSPFLPSLRSSLWHLVGGIFHSLYTANSPTVLWLLYTECIAVLPMG